LAPPPKRRLVLALGTALLAALFGAAPAAANVIGPEPSHSPNVSDGTTLYWIGLIAAVILIVVINAALILAVTRYRARRGVEPRRITSRRRVQLRVTGVLVVLFGALFVVSVIYTDKAREQPASGPDGLKVASATGGPSSSEPLEIKATGQQWLWRYQYPNGAFSYYRLVVPVDTTVELKLDSTDVIHSWYVPQLSGKRDAVPGHVNEAFFRADETGNFYGDSSQFSGQGYAAMRTEVSVVTPDQYTAFIKQLRSDIQSAQDRVVKLIQTNGGPPGSPGTSSPPAGGQKSTAKKSPSELPGPTAKSVQPKSGNPKQTGSQSAGKQANGKGGQ
jgi:cytochrome c oxidase subunit II